MEKCSSGQAAPSLDSATLEAHSCTPTNPSTTLTEDKGTSDPSHTLSSLNEVCVCVFAYYIKPTGQRFGVDSLMHRNLDKRLLIKVPVH